MTVLYVMTAMLNSSLVQSYLGAAAGSYFSHEWGGKVRIGAVDVNPFSHAVLYNIELISPTNDTVFVGERLDCRFHQFPVGGAGLKMDRVELKNARYHLAIFAHPGDRPSLNLSYIIDYFAPDSVVHNPNPKPFTVEVGEVVLKSVDYVMDLAPSDSPALRHHADSLAALPAPRGVSIPHMRFYDIDAHIRDVHVVNDHVVCDVLSLSTTEAGGLRLNDFAAKVEVCGTKIEARDLRLETGSSLLLADARLDYDGWETMADYCHTVWHELTLKPGTRVNVEESGWWAPVLWGAEGLFDIEGHCHGTIDDLRVDSIKASFGTESHFDVRGTIVGLPHIDTTRMDVAVTGLHATMTDIAALGLPEKIHLKPLLDRFSKVRYLDIDAGLNGVPGNCMAHVELRSGVGDLKAKVAAGYDSVNNNFTIEGHIHSDSLGVKGVADNEWLSHTAADIAFEGCGTSIEKMKAMVNGTLSNTCLRGVNLDKTTLVGSMEEGRLDVVASINDSMLRCGLKVNTNLDGGNHTPQSPRDCSPKIGEQLDTRLNAYITFDVERAKVSKFSFLPQLDSLTDFSIHLDANVNVNPNLNLNDDLNANIRLKETRCELGARKVTLDDVLLSLDAKEGYKDISLQCDWFDAAVKGWFAYSDFSSIIGDFTNRFVNANLNPDLNATDDWRSDAFDVDVVWKDYDSTFRQFLPGIAIASGTSIHGSYNYVESLKLVLRSDEVAFGSVALKDIGVTTSSQGGAYTVRLRMADLAVSETDLLKDIKADADLGGRLSSLALRWGDADDTTATAADLQFFLTGENDGYRISLTRPDLYLFGHHWRLVCPGGILMAGDSVDVPMLRLFSKGQSLSAKARMGGRNENYAKVQFDAFSLASFKNILMASDRLSIDGVVTGTFDLLGLGATPYFVADLGIEDLVVNGQSVGLVKLNSDWVSSEQRVNINLNANSNANTNANPNLFEVHGSFIADGTNTMDLDVAMHQIPLQTAGPMIAGFSSNIDGLLSGSLHLGGSLDAPDLLGRAWVDGGLIHVDVTGVTYYFDDTLRVVRDSLVLNDFAVRDGVGNQALLAGSIVYRAHELLMDLNVGTERLMVLDSKAVGDEFFGRLLVGAQGRISGDLQHPAIYVRAQTLQGSELHVPVSSRKQMGEIGFVHFVNYDHPVRPRSTASTQSSTKLNLQLDLTVTPGLKLLLPMDFSEIMADVEAAGNGDLRLTLKGGSEPSVVGRYDFSSGKFSLSLLQLIEKNFAIEEGSSLLFPGNVYDARFDVRAVYNQRVNLATITGLSSGSTPEYTQVQNVIAVKGTLDNPSLKFDIRLPNADQSVVDQVNSLINLSSDRDMLNHTVSLLLLGRFAGSSANSEGEDLLANGFNSINVLASTMGSIVSNMVKFVDVDFKFAQGAVAGSSQIDVGISKQWDKLYFESSFGYGNYGTPNNYSPDLANVLVGDVMVGYKINPAFSFYGFHRTNTSYYTRSEIPYKQGLGLKWSRDFNRFSELFGSKK